MNSLIIFIVLSILLTFVSTVEIIQNKSKKLLDESELINNLKKTRLKKRIRNFESLKRFEGAVRLVGGDYPFQGNVEIFHRGVWGNICDDEWDYLDGNVVCKQLGFQGIVKSTGNGYFGKAIKKYWMDSTFCDGTENKLMDCRFEGWGKSDCENNEAAGVICREKKKNNISTLPKLSFKSGKLRIRDLYPPESVKIRLTKDNLVEIKLLDDWGNLCGDNWNLQQANIICKQLGLGFASEANMINNKTINKVIISGLECDENEDNIFDCWHDTVTNCPSGSGENLASISCQREMADLVFDYSELIRTIHLEDRQLYWLQCAMEENCVASEAYKIKKESPDWYFESRRLLKFTARILNAGTADFRPKVPKHLWEWHMCHMHYHSMEVFATFDIINLNGIKVAEGHKASFCLEDNLCLPNVKPKYKCANYGDQGISVNCTDIYRYNIDCQWIDITELEPGEYILKIAINPELKIGEMTFENNAAKCRLKYSGSSILLDNCILQRP